MENNRSMPRAGCSIPCTLLIGEDVVIEGFAVDVSSQGFLFAPSEDNSLSHLNQTKSAAFKIDMHDFSDIGGVIEFEADIKWDGGVLIGWQLSSIDKANFKKWWFLIYKLFFPKT